MPFLGRERPIDPTPTPPIGELLRERQWLRRLAASLVVDAARAEDLTQQALLAALQHPPRAAGTPRSWLATVARRLARDGRRSDERRDFREQRGAQHETQPATDELVARAELQQKVAAAVLALHEPYRTTLLLAFFEDEPPRAIARRLELPVETVRTRIKRGLELTRERFVAQRGGDGDPAGAAVALLLLVDGARRSALVRALAAKGAITAGSGLTSSFGGGLFGGSATLAAAAAVLGIATWWVIESTAPHGSTIRRDHAASVPPERRAAPTANLAAGVAQPQRLPAGSTADPHEPLEPGSDAWLAAMGLTITESAAGGLPIRITVGASGGAAEGALVLCFDDEYVGVDDFPELLQDGPRLRRTCAELHRTDATGMARVHFRRDGALVFAMRGELHAALRIGPFPVTLALRQTTPLRLRVVDEGGAPAAGVVAGLGWQNEPGSAPCFTRKMATDVDGSATLPDLTLLWSAVANGRAVVGIDAEVSPSITVPIDIDRLPPQPVELRIGDATALEFQLVDDHGAPAALDGTALINVHAESQAIGTLTEVRFTAGCGRLAPLAPGLRWQVLTSRFERGLAPAEGSGPTRRGERCVAPLTLLAPGPCFTLRLVDAAGSALAQREVSGLLAEELGPDGAGRSFVMTTRSDGDGRCTFDGSRVDLDVFRRRLYVTVAGAAGTPPHRATVVPAPRLARETVDFGDVVVGDAPPLVSGRVRRADGRPLARKLVSIGWTGRPLTPDDYASFGAPSTWTDDAGRFAIHGWPAGCYTIRVQGFDAPLELGADGRIDLPARDVEWTVDRRDTEHGWIVGRVRVDPQARPALRNLVAHLQPRSAATAPRPIACNGEGELVAGPLAPGTWDLRIAQAGVDDSRDELARIDGVDVSADAVTLDPRLLDLDLRGRLRVVTVHVVDGDGQPARDALVRAASGDAGDASARFAYAGAEPARFLTTRATLDVVAMGAGAQRASLADARDEVTLRLAPAPPIAVRIAVEPAALAADPTLRLAVSLLPARSTLDGIAPWLESRVDGDGVALVTVPCAGAWEVGLTVDGARHLARTDGALPPPQPLTIPADARAAECVIRLDARQVAAIRAGARGE